MITMVTAGDKNYRRFVDTCVDYVNQAGYNIIVYDLGDLGIGKPFVGRFSDKKSAKIPCKPRIIQEALKLVDDNDIVVWIDSDALISERIDELENINFDIGVTIRNAKNNTEHGAPINAGVVFVKKTSNTLSFLTKWIEQSDNGVSDQVELNKICSVVMNDLNTTVIRETAKVRVFPATVYNNFHFHKKSQPMAKIKHYKSKLRHLYPFIDNEQQ